MRSAAGSDRDLARRCDCENRSASAGAAPCTAAARRDTLGLVTETPVTNSRRALEIALLLAVMAVAAWLRFTNLTELELCHWDEGAYAAGPFGTGTYATAATAPLYAPPLYPLL